MSGLSSPPLGRMTLKEKRKKERKKGRERKKWKERQRRREERRKGETEKERERKEGRKEEKERCKEISSFSLLFDGFFDSRPLGSYARFCNCLSDMIGSLGFSRRQYEVRDAQGSSPNSKSRLEETRGQDVGRQNIPGK